MKYQRFTVPFGGQRFRHIKRHTFQSTPILHAFIKPDHVLTAVIS